MPGGARILQRSSDDRGQIGWSDMFRDDLPSILNAYNCKGMAAGAVSNRSSPHAAMVNLLDLTRIVKYKRSRRADRVKELHRLRELMLSRLPLLDPALSFRLPAIPGAGTSRPIEDEIDAVLCAYIAAHWWFWGIQRNLVYGSRRAGLRRGT